VTENKIKFIIKSMDVLNHTLKLLIIISTYLIWFLRTIYLKNVHFSLCIYISTICSKIFIKTF